MKNEIIFVMCLSNLMIPFYAADYILDKPLILALEKNGENLLRHYTLDKKSNEDYKKSSEEYRKKAAVKAKTIHNASKRNSCKIKS